jgi:hypothetical protein
VLSESSYLTAIYSYTGAACALLLYLVWWLKRHWRASWVALTVLLLAALLLTPAHPNADVPSYAPALIVALFESLTHGPEAAIHAVKPLGAMLILALVLACILRLSVFRRSGAAKAGEDSSGQGVASVEP